MTNPILRILIPSLIPSRYMVDMATYHELHQHNDSGEDATGKDDIGKTAMQSNEPPSDDFLLCLPAKVPAYWFLKKRWGESSFVSSGLTHLIYPSHTQCAQHNRRCLGRICLRNASARRSQERDA